MSIIKGRDKTARKVERVHAGNNDAIETIKEFKKQFEGVEVIQEKLAEVMHAIRCSSDMIYRLEGIRRNGEEPVTEPVEEIEQFNLFD